MRDEKNKQIANGEWQIVNLTESQTKVRLPFSIYLSLFTICYLLFAVCFSPVFAAKAKVSTPASQYKYQQNILKQEIKKDYERSLLPQSGYMTKEEYEELSKDVPNSEKVVPEYKLPKDIKMKYVPQPTYKLVHYNNPPGTPELHIQRRFQFDRQINCTGITSPNGDIMVYPVVYYYAINQCTAGDLFVIPLDKSLSDLDRVKRANVIKRIPTPILSTAKDISEKFIFRTMTPIDFSADGTKLIAKEKIGNVNDGIWQTNLWVYDFNTQQARNLSEVRDAIKYYWKNNENLILDDKRWDINPLGFDANDSGRIIVSAYGYTGRAPKFLGNWSIDCNGEQTQLVSLFNANANVSINGLKLVQDDVQSPSIVLAEEKKQDKATKKTRKQAKKAMKKASKEKKKAYKKKIKEIKQETSKTIQEYNRQQNISGPTGAE